MRDRLCKLLFESDHRYLVSGTTNDRQIERHLPGFAGSSLADFASPAASAGITASLSFSGIIVKRISELILSKR